MHWIILPGKMDITLSTAMILVQYFQNYQNITMFNSGEGVDPYTGLSQEATREAIYTERRFELTFEGHRWFDLLRTGRALDSPVLQKLGIRSYHLLFPIPWSQIMVVNDPLILWQNEGYN
jgi:hypothetical protein